MLFDTHTHLNDETYDGRINEVIDRALSGGVKKMIVVGYDLNSSIKAVEIANKYKFIYASIGIHPSYIKTSNKDDFKQIQELTKNKKVVAIGEIGLDYYHDKDNQKDQEEIFSFFIKLAYKYNKPIIIHSRDAGEDTLKVLKQNMKYLNKGVMHCYSYSEELSKEFIRLGMMISFAGPLTFLNAKTNKEIVKSIDMNNLLIETDCPYLTPHPFRGKENEPKNVLLVAQEVAKLKQIDLDLVKSITYKNACELFGISYEN